jgi:hypothetical protein
VEVVDSLVVEGEDLIMVVVVLLQDQVQMVDKEALLLPGP